MSGSISRIHLDIYFFSESKAKLIRKVIWLVKTCFTYSCATARDSHTIPLFYNYVIPIAKILQETKLLVFCVKPSYFRCVLSTK